ncbi:MAG: amidase [Dehalococcoidia bacterium]|nr:amidase [Dehalococcoidia bacterium]
MKGNSIVGKTISEITSSIKSEAISPTEIVQCHLEQIKKTNPHINAVVQINEEEALRQAEKIAESVKKGQTPRSLHGVPMTLKDSLDTSGLVTTYGTEGKQNFIPKSDASLVRRLKNAGALLLGKTNTPELTLAADTDNLVYGRTANPYKPELSPGGSSGGAAAIIASMGSVFDIGSDTGGSIRIPSHSCGIAGIKPTSGRVPRTGHCISFNVGATESFTQNGPMARKVEDLFPILQVISGPDWIDPYIVPMPLKNPNDVNISKLRIAFHTDNGLMTPTQEIQENVMQVSESLRKLGSSIVESKPPAIKMLDEMDNKYSTGDGREWVKRLLDRAGTKNYSPFMRKRLEEGSPIATSAFTEILETMDTYRSKMASFLRNFDVLICPASAKPALKPGGFLDPENKHVYSYTSAYNVTGWPAGVVRSGETSDGLPISVQVISSPWNEHVVLAVMRYIESEFGGWQPPTLSLS